MEKRYKVYVMIGIATLIILAGLVVSGFMLYQKTKTAQVGQVGSILVFVLGVGLTSMAMTFVYDAIYKRFRLWQSDDFENKEVAQGILLNSVKRLMPDHFGNQGIAFDGMVYRNLDNGEAFTQSLTLALDPLRVSLDMQRKMLQILVQKNVPEHLNVSNKQDASLPALSAGNDLAWPTNIKALDIFQGRAISTKDLVMGVRPCDSGLDKISDSLDNLTHCLVIGASRWGKSAWLRTFLFQIAQCQEPIEVVAIDASGTEFNCLTNWNKLKYPVARNVNDAIAQMQDVKKEIEQRKAMFQEYPIVTKLSEFNQVTGQSLPRIVLVIDEGTSLLNQDVIGDALRELVQTSAQYGITCVVSGQSANYKVMPTQIRDNFSARLVFHTSPTSSKVVLDVRDAVNLRDKGRALLQLPGRELVEVQNPWLERADFIKVLTTGKPHNAMPVIEGEIIKAKNGSLTNDHVDEIMELHYQGETPSAIARVVFGYSNGDKVVIVNQTIAEYDDDDQGSD